MIPRSPIDPNQQRDLGIIITKYHQIEPTVDWSSYIVALHVGVSDVHHRTFINIEIHLPLVYTLNKFIDIFL